MFKNLFVRKEKLNGKRRILFLETVRVFSVCCSVSIAYVVYLTLSSRWRALKISQSSKVWYVNAIRTKKCEARESLITILIEYYFKKRSIPATGLLTIFQVTITIYVTEK